MIVIIKFESYLGGGETLVTRFAQFLKDKGTSFFVLCKYNSYIHISLKEMGVPSRYYYAVDTDCNYYYLSKSQRCRFINKLISVIPQAEDYKFVTSSLRDLYIITDLCKVMRASATHLILHNQDHHYVCRSIVDIVKEKISGERSFNNKAAIECNRRIIETLNNNDSLVPMSFIITKLWEKDIAVKIPESMIVSLPAFRGGEPKIGKNEKTILWIGRLVDFKFASLFAMLNFIRDNGNYKLTIVGDGDRKTLSNYINLHHIPEGKIELLGEISYKDLPTVIANHSIGYAAGTSIIEIAQQGKPVIMALQNNKSLYFKRDICGGVFYNTTKGNLGEDMCINTEDNIQTLISDAVLEIENDYKNAAQKCYDYVNQEYNQNKNFEQYINIIDKSPVFDSRGIIIPNCGILRRTIYKMGLN